MRTSRKLGTLGTHWQSLDERVARADDLTGLRKLAGLRAEHALASLCAGPILARLREVKVHHAVLRAIGDRR